ncbi:hypothetical protein K458DRAFT_407763 [Lentithecium fluviatile CBS 122367]|uniref:Yeast cell wall synthesis Kre9/Knh1-like N-terminal domain-containing protein n=1 Tax=Lentithecium fluviatile CBS 122367 TaxID=1168545 RepID=A0A6G1IPP9_9PLEO|nr:hypothetical protein K458DRAFT_407763 [Lentithecium fluviatile CBS 122367]
MFSKTFLVAFFAALVAAQDNPTSAPATGEVVPGCEPYTLKWNPTTKGTVSIEIISGATQGTLVPVGKVATGIANTGSFVWTPEAALGENAVTGYKIYDDATGTFQYSVPFSVDGSTCKDTETPTPTPEPTKDTYPTGPTPSETKTPEYPTSTPIPSSSTTCTTTSTIYVPPTGTGYPPAPSKNSTAPYPVVPPTTLYPTGTGSPVAPTTTPAAPEFTGAASAAQAGLGLVGAAAAFVFML